MKKMIILLASMFLFSCASMGCVDEKGPMKTFKVVGHIPYSKSGEGFFAVYRYESWIYENTVTHERFLSNTKYGEIGETFCLKNNPGNSNN